MPVRSTPTTPGVRTSFALMFLMLWMVGIAPDAAAAQLSACSAQFIGDSLAGAPALGEQRPGTAAPGHRLLCKRQPDGRSFFALEYSEAAKAPRWLAFNLDPADFGADGCGSFTRQKTNCYLRSVSWGAFQACANSRDRADPFRPEPGLDGLSSAAFSNSGHIRGTLAPRAAFSWHVCGARASLSMAGVAPQRLDLGLGVWRHVEQQLMTWAMDVGPLKVITGTTYDAFPHQQFAVFTRDGHLDAAEIYAPGTTLLEAARTLEANFKATSEGDLRRPRREPNPPRMRDEVRDLPVPTGFYVIVYRPARDGEPPHVIGFLLPHTTENIDQIVGRYTHLKRSEAFWLFAARVDLIEAASGVVFHGIEAELKSVWNDRYFLSRRGIRNVRPASCGEGSPQGVIADSTLEQRLVACAGG